MRRCSRHVDALAPDLIVCAGYMRLIGEGEVQARRGRLLNIHPSLLPAFKGLRTHAQALAAGAIEHGASVHFVTPDLDGGPVIAQARVPVRPATTPKRLRAACSPSSIRCWCRCWGCSAPAASRCTAMRWSSTASRCRPRFSWEPTNGSHDGAP